MILKTVKKEMKDRNLNITDLAKLSGVDRGKLSNWINEKTTLSEINIIKVMESLDLETIKRYKN